MGNALPFPQCCERKALVYNRYLDVSTGALRQEIGANDMTPGPFLDNIKITLRWHRDSIAIGIDLTGLELLEERKMHGIM